MSCSKYWKTYCWSTSSDFFQIPKNALHLLGMRYLTTGYIIVSPRQRSSINILWKDQNLAETPCRTKSATLIGLWQPFPYAYFLKWTIALHESRAALSIMLSRHTETSPYLHSYVTATVENTKTFQFASNADNFTGYHLRWEMRPRKWQSRLGAINRITLNMYRPCQQRYSQSSVSI